MEMPEVLIASSIDDSNEPSLIYVPEGDGPFPMVIGLHTWSFDRFNQIETMLPLCEERTWALILPEFRGPNKKQNPRAAEACGSRLACQDIIDACDYMLDGYPIAREAVFVLGGSGGGHMALMMAGYAPSYWRGVSAWVPITDVAAWHSQNPDYADHITACCGGQPGDSEAIDNEYKQRSPLHHAEQIANGCVFVHHGRYDDSVPFSHTVNLAHKVEEYKPQAFFYEIFDGHHQMRAEIAFNWFEQLLEKEINQSLTG